MYVCMYVCMYVYMLCTVCYVCVVLNVLRIISPLAERLLAVLPLPLWYVGACSFIAGLASAQTIEYDDTMLGCHNFPEFRRTN
jgi:hypothetical protein